MAIQEMEGLKAAHEGGALVTGSVALRETGPPSYHLTDTHMEACMWARQEGGHRQARNRHPWGPDHLALRLPASKTREILARRLNHQVMALSHGSPSWPKPSGRNLILVSLDWPRGGYPPTGGQSKALLEPPDPGTAQVWEATSGAHVGDCWCRWQLSQRGRDGSFGWC